MKKIISRILGVFDTKIVEKGIEKAVKELDLHGKIIDYGCGQMPYNKYFKNSEIIGADINNPTMKSKATIKINNYKIKMPSKSFDIAICAEVIEHTKEPEKVLKELKRLLKKNGHLILTAPLIMQEHNERDYWRYTTKGLQSLVERQGFKVIYKIPLTKNFHSAGHLIGNAIILSLMPPRKKSRYAGAIIAIPLFFIIRGIIAIANKISSLNTGYITSLIVAKKQ